MLREGSSKVWTEPFQALTGQTRMSAQPLIEYFQPLMTFLEDVNGQDVGWQDQCPTIGRLSNSATRMHSAAAALLVACVALVLGALL